MAEEMRIVVEGMEDVLEMDLKKFTGIVAQAKEEKNSYMIARNHEKEKRKNWAALVGTGKFDDEALRKADVQCEVNIRHLSDKVKLSDDKIAFNQNIVERLEAELKEQYSGLKALEEHRRGIRDRLVQ